MKDNKSNALIAITTLIAALIMVGALSFAIGKWSFGTASYHLIIKFPNATGISANSEVKYAGAHAGRVSVVRLIPRKDQTQDAATGQFNAVDVVVEVDNSIELGNDVTATIKQDGFGISAKYVLLTPGPDHNSKALVDGDTVQGEMPFDMADLIQPAGQALLQAKELVTQLQPMLTQLQPLLTQLQPILTRMDSLTDKLDEHLPPLMTHADKFLQDGDSVMGNLNTPESRERINSMLASLRVTTENLKVVTSNAKALTATLADKPWRVFWGGATVPAPPEADVLKSNKVIPLKPEVDVNAAAPSTTPSTTTSPPAKKKSN